MKSAETNIFLLNLHVFKAATSCTHSKIYAQSYDSSTIFTGECLEYIYVLVTWKIPHIAYKDLWMSNTLKYFPKRNRWSYKSLYFVLKKKKISILPPLKNNGMFSFYVLTISSLSPGALFFPRQYFSLLLLSLQSEYCNSQRKWYFVQNWHLHTPLKN